jgi:phosphatidylglycerophosphate synthase
MRKSSTSLILWSLGRPAGTGLEYRSLFQSTVAGILAPTVVAVIASACAANYLTLSAWLPARLLGVVGLGAACIIQGLPSHSPHACFGAANRTTVARGVLVAFLATLLFEQSDQRVQFVVLSVAALAASLDAVDGWLARRTGMASAFGARFDMETDALFILVLSVWAWRLGKAGPWVMAAGLLRYAFVLAAMLVPALRGDLPPSFRRKSIAAVQMIALLVVIAPFVPASDSAPVAALALLTLATSFGIDIGWLLRRPTRT